MKLPFPAKQLIRIGGKFNAPHVEFIFDLRQWSIGLRWTRSRAGMSSYLNMWTFYFHVPMFTVEAVIRHGELSWL